MDMKRAVKNPARRQKLKYGLASRLRASATDAERKLWWLLRNKQFAGLRFRRQQPIGPYVGDFYCSAAKLIIELDGGQHWDEKHTAYDALRTKWLSKNGYRVLRFANEEFLKNPQIVMDGIAHELAIRGVPLPEIRSHTLTNFDPPSRGG